MLSLRWLCSKEWVHLFHKSPVGLSDKIGGVCSFRTNHVWASAGKESMYVYVLCVYVALAFSLVSWLQQHTSFGLPPLSLCCLPANLSPLPPRPSPFYHPVRSALLRFCYITFVNAPIALFPPVFLLLAHIIFYYFWLSFFTENSCLFNCAAVYCIEQAWSVLVSTAIKNWSKVFCDFLPPTLWVATLRLENIVKLLSIFVSYKCWPILPRHFGPLLFLFTVFPRLSRLDFPPFFSPAILSPPPEADEIV